MHVSFFRVHCTSFLLWRGKRRGGTFISRRRKRRRPRASAWASLSSSRDDEGDDPNGAGSHAYGVFTRSFEVDASAQTTSTPVAADDTIDATSGTPETGSVLDNDSDPDGTTPTVSAIETGSVVGGGGTGVRTYPPVLYVADIENAVNFNNLLEP